MKTQVKNLSKRCQENLWAETWTALSQKRSIKIIAEINMKATKNGH